MRVSRPSRPAPTGPAIDLVFDGRCGVCTRAADWVRRRDRRGRIRIHPSQGAGVRERFGLSDADADAAVWAFGAAQEGLPAPRFRGAAAVNRVLDTLIGVPILMTLYRFPPVRWVQDRGYRWVAAHRSRLPGTTPWCTRDPGACGDGGAVGCAATGSTATGSTPTGSTATGSTPGSPE